MRPSDTVEQVEAVVIGAGQAGLAMSAQLRANHIGHVVLERGRVAEKWRSARWDGLVTNGPAWHDRFPGLEFEGFGPEDFVPKEKVADAFVSFAEKMKVPARCGVEVTAVRRKVGQPGFRVETTAGPLECRNVIAATGAFQKPVTPPLVPAAEAVLQLHSTAYRNPAQLPAGAILVVGGGSSGTQIADELMQSGRQVYLSVAAHGRPPRRYRGRDYVWWLGVLGIWDAVAPKEGREHVTIAVSGAQGGKTIDFRKLAAEGLQLVGRVEWFEKGVMHFSPDLAACIAQGDADYLATLDEADAYVARNGLDLPEEPEARLIGPDPPCVTQPIRSLHLSEAGISTIIWATGFAPDFSWLNVDVIGPDGKPRHQRGVSSEPGLYFIGLPWLSRRASSFIYGVWDDARFIADHIAVQRSYLAYKPLPAL